MTRADQYGDISAPERSDTPEPNIHHYANWDEYEASIRNCTLPGHLSIMNGRFCLLHSGSRTIHRGDIFAAKSSLEPGSFLPPYFAIEPSSWQIQHASPLFQIPFEILIMIVEIVPLNALAKLALTCHAFNALTKWTQFHTALISNLLPSDSSHSRLLAQLYYEATLRQHNTTSETHRLPRLGPCIRRLVLRTNAASFALGNARWEPRDIESTNLYSQHLQVIAFVIRHALPNLRCIRFEDCAPIPRGMWTLLTQTPSMRELDLFNCYVGSPVAAPIPPGVASWPLTSLSIGERGTRSLSGNFEIPDVSDDDALVFRLLELTSPTLKRLRIRCCSKAGRHQHAPFSLAGSYATQLKFPHLQEVDLDFFTSNMDFYRAIFANTQLMALSFAVNSSIPSFEQLCPRQPLHYPLLHHLSILLNDGSTAINNPHGSTTACSLAVLHPLLLANPQIRSLQIELDARSLRLLLETILPSLSSGLGFANLTSLSVTLTWVEQDHTALLFPRLGDLLGLKRLRVRVFGYDRRVRGWGVNHSLVRMYLSDLRYLRCLAFGGDTYSSVNGPVSHEYTTETGLDTMGDENILPESGCAEHEHEAPPFPGGVYIQPGEPHLMQLLTPRNGFPTLGNPINGPFPLAPKAQDETCDAEHHARMVREAQRYFTTFPRLEWIYLGGVLIAAPLRPAPKTTPRDAAQSSQRPRILGPFECEVQGLTDEGIEGFLDGVFGWEEFAPRKVEEWAGVGVESGSAVLGSGKV